MNMPTGTKIAVGALVVIVGGTIIYTWTSTPKAKTPVTPPVNTTLGSGTGGIPTNTFGANSGSTTPGLPGSGAANGFPLPPSTGPATLTLSPNPTVPAPAPNSGAPVGVPAARPFVDPRIATGDSSNGAGSGGGKGDYPATTPGSGNGSTLGNQGTNGFRNGFPAPAPVTIANNGNNGSGNFSTPGSSSPNNGSPRPISTTPTNTTDGGSSSPAGAASGESTYTVASGDTLGGIASRLLGSESKWTAIAKANPSVDPNRMKVGTKLRIPSKDSFASASSASPVSTPRTAAPAVTSNTAGSSNGGGNYTVVAGDTLSKIARKSYGNSKLWQKIYAANKGAIGSDPANLRVGMKLTIPAEAIAGVRTDS